MSQSDQSLSGVPMAPTAAVIPRSKTNVVCRWLFRRLVTGALVGFLVAFATAVLLDNRTLWSLLEKRDLVPWGWLVNGDLTIRWRRVWAFGMLLGLCLPNARLPEKLKRVVLASLIGMPIALFGLLFMDAVLAAAAVDRTYAPFANIKLDVAYDRPLANQKFYPSVYRTLFDRTLFAGCGCGLIVGAAWASVGIKRGVLAAIAVIGVTVETWSQASHDFDSYVESQQKWIRERIGGTHAE